MKNKKLAKEILTRVKREQQARVFFTKGRGKRSTFKKLDRENTAWLKKIIAKHGWPTIADVGRKAEHGAWLLVQHADHDLRFQKKVLQTLKSLHSKNPHDVISENIAFLTDRILVHEKKLQFFGTQVRADKSKKLYEFLPIRDVKNVDKRRREYGLEPLQKSLNSTNKKWARYIGKK